MAIFEIFFFLGNIGREKVFYDILQRKNAFLGYKNKKFKKAKNRHFSKRVNPWFWSKNGHVSNIFFRHYSLENVLYDILARKKPFKSIKKRSSNSRKIDIFPNGLTHRFGPKMTIFSSSFFLGNICQQNVFYDILEQKNAFLGYKNKNFRKSKN